MWWCSHFVGIFDLALDWNALFPGYNGVFEYKVITVATPLIVDLEATGLGENSFPIEISWVNHKGKIFTHFISVEGVDNVEWDENISEINRITLEDLEDGLSVNEVVALLEESIGDGELVIYTDGVEWDEFWLRRLYSAAECKFPGFKFIPVEAIPLKKLMDSGLDFSAAREEYNQVIEKLRMNTKKTHRAKDDVMFHLKVINEF